MNSDSDDSDESDIGALLDRAKKSKSRRTAPSVDSEDDLEEEETVLIQPSSKKPKNMSVDEKIAVLDHERKMSARKRESMFPSDSDNDSSDEEVQVTKVTHAGTPPQNDQRAARLRNRQQKQQEMSLTSGQKPPATKTKRTVFDVYSSSDDDDDGPATSEISAEASRQLSALRQAREQLQNQRPTIDVDDDQEVIAIDNDSPVGCAIKLTVELSVDTNSEGLQKRDSIEMTVNSNDQLENVHQAILRELQLPSDKKATCRIRHGSQALRLDRTANDYGLESPCTLHANVFVTSWVKRAKPAAPKFGPILVLYLRKGDSKTKIEYGLRQPFAELIQKHGKLHFDGLSLQPTSTPEDLDMENDDQIDVPA